VKRIVIVLLIGLVLGVVLSTRLTFPSHAATAGRYAAFAGNHWLHDGRITIRPSGWGLFSYSYLYTCPHGVGTCRGSPTGTRQGSDRWETTEAAQESPTSRGQRVAATRSSTTSEP